MHAGNQALGGQGPLTAGVGQLIESSIAGLSQKLRSFLGAPPATGVALDAETVHTRELQSQRIKLRLLARQGQLDLVCRTAITTVDEEIATVAVLEILNADVDNEQRVQMLAKLARSGSQAAIPATVVLFNQRQLELAQSIFLERLNNGELAEMIRHGKAKLFSVLDILGALDEATGTSFSQQYFETLFCTLADSPNRQHLLLAEILGDPKPEGFRCSYERNMISQAVKLQAIALLQHAPVSIIDRALSYGAKSEDDTIAHNSIWSLMHLWRSQHGRIPQGLEPFCLLDINLLVQLCQISSAFQWPDSSGADRVLENFTACLENLEREQPDTLPFEQLSKQAEQIQEEIVRITECRINSLQPLVDRITAALGVPNAKLAASDDEALCAAYLVGTGSIEINRRILLEDKPLSEELMSSLLHEVGHMEQDVLVIRMIADDLKLKFGQHAQLLLPLYERYAAGIGYAPMSMFLLAVLRLRDDQPLTAAQRQRAMRLLEAAHQTKLGHEQGKILQKRLDHLSGSEEALSQGAYDAQLLLCLRSENSLASLFNRGEIPAVLLYEIRDCRKEIEQIVASLNGHDRIRGDEAISQAQTMYHSQNQHLVAPTVERMKTLLLQVLSEEDRRLQKQLSEIRRAGYHEAEAYTISDRVEVIVKALRKGW
jgi:hypothetical protein